VKAFGAAGNGSVWNVSNGLENGYDLGVAPNSIGRDVLFYVGALTPSDGSDAENKQVVSDLDLTAKVIKPVAGQKPTVSVTSGHYTGTVIWTPNHDLFEGGVSYTATVMLWAEENFTFIKPDPGKTMVTFTHDDATLLTATGHDTGVIVTIVFPPDGSLVQVTDLDLTSYIPAPIVDQMPPMFFSSEQYTVKSIIWSPLNDLFLSGADYTATVTLMAKPGYTLNGVTFTHTGAASITSQDNGNETITLTIKFQKTKTTAIVYITGLFSDSNAAGSNTSAVDAMKAHAGYDSLRITMATAGTATLTLNGSYDMGTGLVLNPVNYPANLSINGGNRVIGTSGVVNNPLSRFRLQGKRNRQVSGSVTTFQTTPRMKYLNTRRVQA
jgi:hypothetical protein